MKNNDIIDILEFIENNDVRFIRLQFCDLYGRNRNISIPSTEFEHVLTDGMPFITSSVPGYSLNEETELMLVPDARTIITLPWRPQHGRVARVLCNICYPQGKRFEGDCRQLLIKTLEKAQEQGLEFDIGAKIEFYLFDLDEEGNPTVKPADEAGFFDLAPVEKCENTRREIILTLEEMGFSITSSHHEEGSGQNEIDFRMSDPLTCADNIQTFKSAVKTIAEQNGLHASFMPKPLNNEPGSGMHIVISAYKDGKNVFTSDNGQISPIGEAFAAGILAELPAITVFANPIVNSYKRLVSSFDMDTTFKWDPNNPNAIIRIPKVPHDRVHLILRTPDAAANPYILFSLILSAGLMGIDEGMTPQELEIDMPMTLHKAIELARENNFISLILDNRIKDDYLDAKYAEWYDYITTVHDWEINKYFRFI